MQHGLSSVSESGESARHGLSSVGESGESARHGLSNVGESRESRVFQKTAVLASTRTRQKRRVSREYSNSLNSPASSHCLLLTQGFHHERQKTFYLKQNNIAEIGRFSFENRLNNILCLLGDNWLDLSQVSVKRMLNDIILQNIPAKYV